MNHSELKKEIILMKLRVGKYLEFLCDRSNRNSDKIKQIRSTLNIQYASLEKYIKEIGNDPKMNDGVNPGYYSVYQNAFSADILQRVGPSSEAVLQDLDYITGKLQSMTEEDFSKLSCISRPQKISHNFDEAILEALADFICGDDNVRYPVYRSSYYLTNFFKTTGIDVEHDGSTRKIWVYETLKTLSSSQIEKIILRLADIREYKGNKEHLSLAIKTMNDILLMDGLGIKLTGVKPEIITVESIVLEQGVYIESAIQDISQILPKNLIEKLQKDFSIDLKDLEINFDKSGNGTAFFLRKILEKLLYIVFSKNGLGEKLKVGDRTMGLEAMIGLASQEKINGLPIIHPKTAKELCGIKFLGDTSAHNPLTNVDMATIKPQLPFLVTALEEISNNL